MTKKSSKKRKYVMDKELLHSFNYSSRTVSPYSSVFPAFDVLLSKLGNDITNKILDMAGFDYKDTVLCMGDQCPERLFKTSSSYFCDLCEHKMKDDGYKWCFMCNIPVVMCEHNKNKILKETNIDKYCMFCDNHIRKCVCL